jgi:hypothetical protein
VRVLSGALWLGALGCLPTDWRSCTDYRTISGVNGPLVILENVKVRCSSLRSPTPPRLC